MKQPAQPAPVIIAAAIRQDGNVYVGQRHSDIIHRMVADFHVKPPVTGEQGFITSREEFLSRREAAKVALSSRQIKRLKYSTTELFSEDLW